METERAVLGLFPEQMRPVWQRVARDGGRLQEIRLRAQRPALIYTGTGEWYLERTGLLTRDAKKAYVTEKEELQQIVRHICRYSLYACEEELRKGYVSADGGLRVGVAGEVIVNPDQTVKNVRYISSINIRVAREVKGAALGLLPYLYKEKRLCNCLVISPPGCGKTTLLRDIVRLVSDGNAVAQGKTVGLVDERCEIAGCFQGIPQKDVGMRTDVLDNCPKAEGMMMLIRSMAPELVALDELGSAADVEALGQVQKCGCSVVATVHGASLEEMGKKPLFAGLFQNRVFDRFFVLGKREGKFWVEAVHDENGAVLERGILC